MRVFVSSILIGIVFLLGSARQGLAIAVADYSVAVTNPAVAGYNLDWDYIYNYQAATAVAVDHYWLLTAAHVADDNRSTTNLTIGGELYTQQEIVPHISADLALVRYDKPFPGYYALHDGEIFHEETETWGPGGRFTRTIDVYDPLLMVGFGYAGTVSSSSFTEGGAPWIKRWGTNRGEDETTVTLDVGDSTGTATTKCFQQYFNLTDTAYEAGGNIYDSGGPIFIEDGSDWKLTGINLYRQGTSSTDFVENRAAMIHDYIAWIKSVITDYDTDMDGLPDWWEDLYGQMEGSGYSDSDAFTNYEEWLADTVPVDGASFLSLAAQTNAPGLIVLNSSENRRYQLEYRTDLMNTNAGWQTEGTWFPGAASQTPVAVPLPASNRFYRVRASLY